MAVEGIPVSGLVLIADGDHERARRVAAACEELGLRTRLTMHGAAALEASLADVPAALVVQLGLPLIDGAQLGGILRTNPRTKSIGLLYVADTMAQAARSGLAGQVVAPPVDPHDVARLVHEFVQERTSSAQPEPDDETGGVEGQLSQLPLSDLLQLFHVSRKSGVVEVRRREAGQVTDQGTVALRDGDLVHASVGAVSGEKALYRLLAWERGDFNFRPGGVSPEPTLTKPARALLREGLRQIEEMARMAGTLPPMDAVVRLKIRRASLPIVIHPLTQEVLLVLEAYSRVADVVEHCSFPDYQVLRTLHTLIDRGIVEVRRETAFRDAPAASFFSAARGARLQEWLGVDRSSPGGLRDAKLLVIPSDASATRAFCSLLGALPGAQLETPRDAGDALACDVRRLGRLAVDAEVGIEFMQIPPERRYSALWPIGGQGAVGVLLLLAGSVSSALESVGHAAETLRRLPRARIFHLLLLDKEGGVEPDVLRENLSLFDESSLFLVPHENNGTAQVLLREMFVRILP